MPDMTPPDLGPAQAVAEPNLTPAPLPAEPAQAPPAAGVPRIAAYAPPAGQPTQEGPEGIRFDFNLGARVTVPEGKWHVRLADLDTGNTLFAKDTSASFINSSKRWFVRFRIEVSRDGKEVFAHNYSARGRKVLIQFPIGSMGDTIGWFPYAAKFAEKHGCHVTCAMAEKLADLFRDAYPEIAFITPEQVKPEEYYATYHMGLFFDDAENIWQPCDFRFVGLHRTAGYILGVDPADTAPRIAHPDASRPIAEPYVVIAAQSSTQSKFWNNPDGWREVVRFLRASGYRVICIDKAPVHGAGIVWNHIPHGAEDETGDRPLLERARWLAHADFFIGLSSGLSWLAWAAGTPVVLISGFTHPLNEFATPFRVVNYHVCNSCWNDPHHRFDHKDFLWCPRHAGTPRQFECTRLITTAQVIDTIRRIPAFAHNAQAPA